MIGSVFMPTFLMISRHSPENCPINNEKMKKITLELPEKMSALEKKHAFEELALGLLFPNI